MAFREQDNISAVTKPHRVKTTDTLFDLNRILFLLKRHWYLYVISIPLFVGAVYIYHKYAVSVYQARATLMLKGGSDRSVGGSEIIQGFGLSAEAKSIENQMFVIRSKKLVQKAMDRLDFGVTYIAKGLIEDAELYYDSPFRIEFDSLHAQILNVPINITFLDGDDVSVSMECEGGRLYQFDQRKSVGSVGAIEFEQTVKYGEWITQEQFSFRIVKTSYKNDHKDFAIVFKTNSQLADEYRGSLGVSAYREGSSIVFISTVGTNYEKIKLFLDQLCEVIIESNLEQKNNMATRSLTFINAQLNNIADTLDKVQNQLLEYRKDNRFMGPSEFSKRLADQYFDAEKQMKMIEMQESYFKYLRTNLDNASDIEDYMLPVVDSENVSYVNQLVMQLLGYEEEKNLLLNSAEEDNQYLRNLDSKISLAKTNLLKALNQVLRSLEMEKQDLKSKLGDVLVDMDELPSLEKTYLKIDRTYKLNDAIYTFLLQKQSETQIAKASNAPDSEVIDKASVSAIVSPNKKGNYQKGILFALLLPSAFIVLKEFLNKKIRTKEDVQFWAPDVPIVGNIVHSNASSTNVIYDVPNGLISESFRSVRTKLKYLRHDQLKVLTITSTNSGEGKTFCAENLASVFAISGKKTVLLGFDLRKPRLTALFELINKPGLSNYLIGDLGKDEIIYKSNYKNLDIIPAGPIPPNPSELISGDGPKELFAYLREHYDVIIVDSPPIGVVADARMLMQESDYNIYIVRANYTMREHMSITVENLMEEGMSNLGIVINDVALGEKNYGYYSSDYYSDKQAYK